MPTTRSPRRGSMQYWPRKRAKKHHARVRQHAKPIIFAGYKVGMTHAMFTDSRPNSNFKGMQVNWPVTVVECPPLRIAGIALYTKDDYGTHKAGQIIHPDKEFQRIQHAKNNGTLDNIKPENYSSIRLIAQTQPKLTAIGKKKPELFEITLKGTPQEQLETAKQKLGKEITLKEALQAGAHLDTHAVTKGKGYAGPVKRFHVAIRQHKSEKTKRGIGTLGPWHGANMTKVAHAGQLGFQTRTERNKLLITIGHETEKINQKAGFARYGNVKNEYALFKGSLPGSIKRLIKFTQGTKKPEHIQLTWIKI
ncbi:50S ribosomal protein L3 [Candidatus Woesearchaeota archaeon]|nr:50S ribosomal protein L3 [Candidatus Woesearchaeota archaeon]